MTGMTRERFEDLALAYGGRIARWPVAERDAAALFAEGEPDLARAALENASTLDDALEAWTTATPGMDLREAIVAAAPAPRRRPAFRDLLWRAGAGAGLAAACAAGLLVGVSLSPDPHGEDAVATAMTSFEVATGEEVG